MGYKSEPLVSQIRDAREARGISQRALSERTGQTQSHISQVETGRMEPGLSSFIDMARALDLEVMLVPKTLVPGVRGLVRSQAMPRQPVHAGRLNDKQLARAARRLKAYRDRHGSSADLDRLDEHLHALRRADPGERDMRLVRAQIDRLDGCLDGSVTHPEAAAIIRDVAFNLQRLRMAMAQDGPAEPRPAYRLDDGEGDG